MTTDDRQIEALFARLKRAWTDNDGSAYGACFTEDSDYVSYDGTRAVGRAAMQEAHDRLFRGVLAGSALVGELESIRHVAPGVAIVHGTGSVLPWRSKLPRRRQSRQTLVAVRTNDGWRFAALHNSRVRPVSIPAPNSMPSRMSQLMARLGGRSASAARPPPAPEPSPIPPACASLPRRSRGWPQDSSGHDGLVARVRRATPRYRAAATCGHRLTVADGADQRPERQARGQQALHALDRQIWLCLVTRPSHACITPRSAPVFVPTAAS